MIDFSSSIGEFRPSMVIDSEVYQAWEAKCKEVAVIARQMMAEKKFEMPRKEAVTKELFSVGSDMHRGYYCPSPSYDIIISGVHRGKLLKKLSEGSAPSHHYVYTENELCCVHNFYKGRSSGTEYLFRQNDRRYGFLVNPKGIPTRFAEEIYSDDLLRQFVLIDDFYEDYPWGWRISVETYRYDELGLSECSVLRIERNLCCNENTYKFNRKNGYIESWDGISNPAWHGVVRTRRLANPPFF